MALLEENLAILKGRYPELAASYREPVGVKIERRKNHPSLRFKGVLLHSGYDPIQEAKRLVAQIPFERLDLLFVFGFGLGYHLEELKRLNRKPLIFVVEPEYDIFFTALSLIDLRDILSSYQFELSIGEDHEHVLERLNQRFELIKTRRTYTLEHPASLRLNPAYFNGLKDSIQDFIDHKITQAQTLSRFGYDFQRNIVRNIPWIVRFPGVKGLFGRFSSIPAIIIAAGPSLDRDLETLKEAKGKALLISVDTALPTLLGQGVIPDLVVAIDPQEVNLRYFGDLDLSDLFLVVGSIAYWGIAELSARKFFFLSDHPICRWLAGFDDKGIIDTSGGSVTTASFDLAVKLGADPIILVGTDFAYPEGLTHTRGVDKGLLNGLSKFRTLEMANREFLSRDSLFVTEGVGGREVFTDRVLYGYLVWLTRRIKRLPSGGRVINSSYGARIKAVKELALKESLDLYCQEDLSIREIIEDSYNLCPEIDLSRFIKEIEAILKELNEIEGFSKEYSSILERARGGENGLIPDAQRIERTLNRYEKGMNLLEVAFYSTTFNERMKSQIANRVLSEILFGPGDSSRQVFSPKDSSRIYAKKFKKRLAL